jgi:hypothetical protein
MASEEEKYAAECGETSRKLAALFNPRTRIPWDGDKSVIVIGVLDPVKPLHVTIHTRVENCDVPNAKTFVHSDGGATTFVFPAGCNFADSIDAVFRLDLECVTVSTKDRTRSIPHIPKTVFRKHSALPVPAGLTNAEAYVVASKTADSMTAVLDALVDTYVASGSNPRSRKWSSAKWDSAKRPP